MAFVACGENQYGVSCGISLPSELL